MEISLQLVVSFAIIVVIKIQVCKLLQSYGLNSLPLPFLFLVELLNLVELLFIYAYANFVFVGVLKTDANSPATNSANLSSSTVSSPASTLSFEEFRKRKEASRSSFFTKKNPKKRKGINEEVKIQVGLLHMVDGRLRKMKGRTLPVTVSPNVDASSLLEAAVEKHGKHFQQFKVSHKYALLYPDYTLVSNLPGNFQEFSLVKYKEDLGKSYAKVYFWLCKYTDFEAVQADSDCEETDQTPPIGEQNVTMETTDREQANTGVTANAQICISPCPATTISAISDPILICDQESNPNPIVILDHSINGNQASSNNPIPPGLSGVIKEVTALCPTCYRRIPITIIEEHADLCADKFDPVGEVQVINTQSIDMPDTYIDDVDAQLESDAPSTYSMAEEDQKMKAIVDQLQSNIDLVNKTRISVRRKNILEDFLAIRKKPWFNLSNVFKVTFIGEPAIDDGGPRREFFSGLFCNLLMSYIRFNTCARKNRIDNSLVGVVEV